MANITTYLENALLQHSLGKAAYAMPTTVYAALYTATPTTAGGGTEVNGTGYVRIATSWNLASNGSITTFADLRFPASGGAGGAWGTVIAIGLLDSLAGGNLLWFGNLSSPVTLGTGDDFKITAGNLTVSLS